MPGYDAWKTLSPDDDVSSEEPTQEQQRADYEDERRQMSDDFCLIHGYEHMKTQWGNPIPYCEACDRERERTAHEAPAANTAPSEDVGMGKSK